jgi:competence protein ComEC
MDYLDRNLDCPGFQNKEASKAAMALLIFILVLMPHFLSSDSFSQKYFVIWNIGQGQWTTMVSKDECLHFDMGGEKNISSVVTRFCQGKLQKIFLSHWDWDHIGFTKKYSMMNPRACLAVAPIGPTTEHKRKLLSEIPFCSDHSKLIYQGQISKTSNDQSHVEWANGILIPGDSTNEKEKIWAANVPGNTFGLVLGHHGSRSSTSELLLAHLQKLKWAVSSARFARYHHPHFDVVSRLGAHHVPLLRTEDWGTIVFIQPEF